MSLYKNRRVLVTGGLGFLASHLIEALGLQGAIVRAVDVRTEPENLPQGVEYLCADLRQPAACQQALRGVDYVFHLAAVGWGLHENMKRQPQLLSDNLLLNTTLLDAAYRAGVRRYLYTSSSAVYPAYLQDLEEDSPWDQPPHDSELAFGWAKRVGEIQARVYYRHYGMPIAIVRPANPYGPGDNFDPKKSHVIPALIRRAMEREHPFTVWGTGSPVRSFIHARDAARGMLLALEKYAVCEPVNLASSETTTIAELVKLVVELAGYGDAQLQFDSTKPDGHPRKVPSVRRAAEKLGLVEYIPLREGLKETIAWYAERHQVLQEPGR
ncbi:MAG: NAD-dependent epimerase/dehydratase family protein [Acidobacteria bacterium]|nr:NAD-dependent epimerase/dehydratase family protein [Acidobacteriota bacterium]